VPIIVATSPATQRLPWRTGGTTLHRWRCPGFTGADNLAKAEDEKRMVVKQIIASNAYLNPDYKNNTLTIKLHSLSAQRFNAAAWELTKILNETETLFPGTNLKMIFEISAISFCAK